jgi:hypothetical protein
MITCTPKGLCSTDYYLTGGGRSGEVVHRAMSEQGSVQVGDEVYAVHKAGVFKDEWTMGPEEQPVARAAKSSVLSSTIDLEIGGVACELRVKSTWSTQYVLWVDGQAAAIIRKVHAFTNRAVIEEMHDEVPFELLCFAFWLVSLLWSRASTAAAS